VDIRTTISIESTCQVACSWVDVGRFYKRLVVRFMIFTASVKNILDKTSYAVALYRVAGAVGVSELTSTHSCEILVQVTKSFIC
jgi:hypothetical protein